MIKLIKSTFFNENKTKRELTAFIRSAEILSFGSECQKFEVSLAKYQERAEAVFVNSGSSANLAVMQALLNTGKLNKGDKVGFSSITWSTNVMPLIQLGLEPVPVDVELATLNTSLQKLQEAFKHNNLKAFFITNLLGFCDNLELIAEFCEEHKILLIEDNCEAMGSEHRGKKLGNYGFASTFSFYVGHHMSTIEGGAICTDDSEFATALRLVRAHGWDRNLSASNQEMIRQKYQVNSSFYSRYTFYDLGYNFRPTEINGFLGNNQLQYIERIVEKRQKNFLKMHKIIAERQDLYFPLSFSHMDTVSNFAYPLVCRSREVRDQLVKICDNIVEIRPIVGGDMTHQPFYGKYVKIDDSSESSTAHFIHENGLYFGNNPELSDSDTRLLCEIFADRIKK